MGNLRDIAAKVGEAGDKVWDVTKGAFNEGVRLAKAKGAAAQDTAAAAGAPQQPAPQPAPQPTPQPAPQPAADNAIRQAQVRTPPAPAAPSSIQMPEGNPGSAPYGTPRRGGQFTQPSVQGAIEGARQDTLRMNRGAPVQPYPNPSGMPGGGDIGHTIQRAAADSGLSKVNLPPQAAAGGAGGAVPPGAPPAAAAEPAPRVPRPLTPQGEAALKAGRATMTNQFPSAAKVAGGGLRGAMGTILGPGVVAAVEGYNVGKTAMDPNSTGTDVMREVGRSTLRGGATLLGGAGGAALGSLAGPVGTFGGAAAGGTAGYAAGDYAANKLFGPAKAVPTTDAAATPTAGKATVPGADADMPGKEYAKSGIPTVRGANVSPEQLIKGNDVPTEGNGAFKRTTKGNEGEATKVSSPKPAESTGYQRRTGYGLGDALVTLAGKRYEDDQAMKKAELGVKRSAADLAKARFGMEMGDKARKNLESQIVNEAEASSTATGGITNKNARKEDVDKRAAELRRDVEFTVGNRKDKKAVEDLSPAEQQQLFLAHRVRNNINEGRGEWGQAARDFFGIKRADSRDLYSYMPAKVERASIPGGGGYVVHSKNGNTMTIKQAQGGRWTVLGPNTPIDADMAALIAPHIAELERSSKGGK